MDNLKENPYFKVEERLENFQNERDYTMSRFSDRVVERPWTFEEIDIGTNPATGNPIIAHQHSEGEIIEEGTDLSEKNLGNLDVAIAILYKWRAHVDDTMLTLLLKADALEASSLNGMIANVFTATFKDLENIKIIRGYYDEQKGQVWS